MHGPLNVKNHSVILFKFPLEVKTNFSVLNGLPHFKHIPFLPEEYPITIPVFIIDRIIKQHLIPAPAASRELMECLIYIVQ
jgi:hypothetical protein